jgi:hypothetical protein
MPVCTTACCPAVSSCHYLTGQPDKLQLLCHVLMHKGVCPTQDSLPALPDLPCLLHEQPPQFLLLVHPADQAAGLGTALLNRLQVRTLQRNILCSVTGAHAMYCAYSSDTPDGLPDCLFGGTCPA